MNEFLPIRFEVGIIPAKWTSFSAEPVAWSWQEDWVALVVQIPGRGREDPKEAHVNLDHLPSALKPDFPEERVNLLKENLVLRLQRNELRAMTVFEYLAEDRLDNPQPCDPRGLRDEFLDLKEDTEALLKFLNDRGAWQDGFHAGMWDFARNSAKIVSPYYFWHYRTLLRKRIEEATREPATWFASTVGAASLHRIPQYPFHSCRISYLLDAIELSVTLDLLKDVPMSLCARDDCRKAYFVTRKSRKFCSEECARCMVMRRARAKKKIEKSEG